MKGSESMYIGTSGWHYDHWRGSFYPQDLAADQMLEFYRKRFRTVEVNNSFYQLPEAETLHRWRDTVPEGFLFSVKASRYITHMKKLKDPEQSVETFLDRIQGLEDTLGPILFQLPPRWKINPDRLDAFLSVLPKVHRYAFEFRDPSWFDPKVYFLLAKHEVAFCIYELAGEHSPRQTTTDFVYIRLHGPGRPYQGSYDTQTLAGWAGAFSAWSRQGKRIYCYFDNDEAGYAVQDAARLSDMVGGG